MGMQMTVAQYLWCCMSTLEYKGIFTLEVKFHPTRMWRFDFADVERKIAVEAEGGIWKKGRHTHPVGYINDIDKYNAAQIEGWIVLRYASVEQAREFIGDYEKVCALRKVSL